MFFIPEYILILLVTILIDYYAAIKIEKAEGKRRKRYLVISIVSTCLVLFAFKYFDFFNDNILSLCHQFGFNYEKANKLLLPIGLSFHTFQSLSYVIEVYRGKQKAEKHFGIYSLYVMFYPQLVAGPIERPQNLLVQLREEKKIDYSNLIAGLRLILFGLFIKMVVADNIAVYVDQIYEHPSIYSTASILTGLLFYSFQIYCDFYGYSTIAIGCAKAMGYNLMDNFKNPYLSKSVTEFWQRWHISLSTWFRDYVYFSMGGNKVKYSRWIFNILIVFLLSGLWHGANWTFVAWGLVHGLVYIIDKFVQRKFKFKINNSTFVSIINIFRTIKTFIIVSFAWILFRAKDFDNAGAVFKSIFTNYKIKDSFSVEPKVWLFFGFFILIDLLLFKNRFDNWCLTKPSVVRWAVYSGIIFLIIVFSSVENFPFIYFQF